VKDGDTIPAEPPLQISDMLKKTSAILDSAQTAVRNIDDTAGNLQSITAKLDAGKGTAGAFVNDRALYEHVTEAAANLQDDTEALKHNFLLRGFFKSRGYQDRTDLKRNAISQLPSPSPQNRLSYRGSKLFDKPDSAKIKNGKLLDEAGRYLEQTPYGLAVIASYADQKGDSEKQLELTQARAAVVRAYLAEHFKIDDTRIKTFGGGESLGVEEGGELQIVVYPPSVSGAEKNTGSAGRKK
jgi:outer membrane protein OmpA-like peptidoglycan-associated protein